MIFKFASDHRNEESNKLKSTDDEGIRCDIMCYMLAPECFLFLSIGM